jgi:hypothetical protein
MARLVIITHEFDIFAYRRDARGPVLSTYLLYDVLRHLETLGHEWRIAKGPQPVPGDVAILHVDSTIVGDDYLALASLYPRTLNFGTGDISKRAVSRNLLSPGDDWDGPVIVKADLNCNAETEHVHNMRAQSLDRPLPHPGVARTGPHILLDRLGDVPDEIWADPALVVEKFLPERDAGGGYVMRTWVFMGQRERSTRIVTPGWIGKASEAVLLEPQEVPEALRAERERLDFDFGKFDFVLQDGVPMLLDANRTPGTTTAVQERTRGGALNLAAGLDEIMREAARNA